MSTTRSLESTILLEEAVKHAPPRKHVLDLDDYTREEITLVIKTTDAMKEVLRREIKKVPTLRGKIVINLFMEPSTRTRISFEEAGKLLSAEVINMSASGSSTEKGESLLDSVRTLQAMGMDILVMRHPHAGAPYFAARSLDNVSVVNAGDGTHAHPSQALLDLYTMQSHLGELQGRKVVMVGDILHSRVARSNIWGLSKMGGRVVLCGPPTLLPLEMLKAKVPPLVGVVVDTDLERAIRGADVVMALRVQFERQQASFVPSLKEYVEGWQVNAKRLKLAKEKVLVMHPGPMNEGVEISPDVAHGPRSVVEEQVSNGVAVRMALLYLLAGPKA